VNPGEKVVGFGRGGSESLTLILEVPGEDGLRVRKVLSERLVTPAWDRHGAGVMLPPFAKARSQVLFLEQLPPDVQAFFPKVLDLHERTIAADPSDAEAEARGGVFHELFYDMSFVPGIEISELVRRHGPPPAIVARLYEMVFSVLAERIHCHRIRVPARPTIEPSYFTKIVERLALARRTAPRTFCDQLVASDRIHINGRTYLNIGALLAELRGRSELSAVLEPGYHALVIGDTNTENIKITNPAPILAAMRRGDASFAAHEIGIRFLDPRAIGFHEGGRDTGSDDPMYDNKPWHNSLGNYDAIHGEYFDLTMHMRPEGADLRIAIHRDCPYRRSYDGLAGHFKEVMTRAWSLDDPQRSFVRDDPYWLIRFVFVMGTHFAAMPPFHVTKSAHGVLHDDPFSQRRAVALYAEGIKWLNLAVDMLHGRVRHYLGFDIPALPRCAFNQGVRTAAHRTGATVEKQL
jgi:hypothetical protein